MNWLAHLYLSEPDTEFRLGNLLADQVKGADRQRMSPAFLRGVTCHQAIDAFTENHPLVKHSRTFISPEQRRFSGILIDVFYDHFLARNWSQFSDTPLEQFTHSAYAEFQPLIPTLPEEARITLERIIEHDWLSSYREIAGIEDVLERLSGRLSERLKRPMSLHASVKDLRTSYGALESDFMKFMPELQERIMRDVRGDSP
ncbi:MAG TPA: ACP phosphodiesterase [Verrucomicrobiae bacterium]